MNFWQRFWRFQRKNNGFAILQRYYDRHLTAVGKALLLLFTVSFSLGLVGTQVSLYILFCLMFGLLFGTFVIGFISRPHHLELIFTPPPPKQVRSQGEFDVEVRNTGKRPLFHLLFEIQLQSPAGKECLRTESPLFCLEASKSTHFKLPWTPGRRGAYQILEISLISVFPLGLVHWRKSQKMSHQGWSYPDFLPTNLSFQPSALDDNQQAYSRASFRPDSLEFHGIRPWQPGDSPRYIHWPTLARTGQVNVREFQEPSGHRLAIFVDTHCLDSASFETAISAAAWHSFQWLQQSQNALVALCCGTQLTPFRQGVHQQAALEVLATLEPADWQVDQVLEALNTVSPLSGILLIFAEWGPLQQALYLEINQRGQPINILITSQTDSSQWPAEARLLNRADLIPDSKTAEAKPHKKALS